MNVEAWLKKIGLEQYADAFRDNEIDAGILLELTSEDIKEIGVGPVGHRRKILSAIATLKSELDKQEGERSQTLKAPETPSATIAVEGDRRLVTVLFADLADFTSLSNTLGAEETHNLLNRYFGVVDRIVESYGGTIDKHIGDSVMATFGAPKAHDNDPERAVRSACEIHHSLDLLASDLSLELKAHIGIASGQVVASGTGSEAHREYTVTGEAVNLASRLQDKAAQGVTLVSEPVYQVAKAIADFSAVGEIEVKGFNNPISVWRVKGLRTEEIRGLQTPFVGRRAELAQFIGVIEVCRDSGQGQAVLLRGDAGIGKTRITEEFEGRARDRGYAAHKALALDFGVGKGQDPIRALVRRLLGIPPGSTKAVRRAAAGAAIDEGLLDNDRMVFLNDLLDLPQSTARRSLYDAMDNTARNQGKRATVAALVRTLANRQPQLLVVEDVHWADDLTLAYLAEAAKATADCRAVLVLTTRAEGDVLDRTWRASLGDVAITTIDLRPLRDDEAMQLAQSLTNVEAHYVKGCIERAEGNPFFLEQLLRGADEGASDDLPTTIQSLVLARLDRLVQVDKRALQAASVIGQRFDREALCYLLNEPEHNFETLVENHLIRPEGEGYLFAHALIQDGAYTSLLKSHVQALHLKAAEWFAETDPILKAEHLDRGGSPEAAEAYREAAESQAAAYRYLRALELVGRGLDLVEDAGKRSLLVSLKGDLLHDNGEIRASVDAYREALDLAVDDAQRCRSEIGFAAGMRMLDRYDEAFAALDRAEAIAKRHDFHLQLARLHHLRGNLHFPLGQLESCWKEHNKALAAARQAKSPEWEARALGGLGDAEYARGHLVTADDYLNRCMELCRQHGFGRIEVANLPMLGGGGTTFYRGDLEGAMRISLEAVSKASAVGHDRAELVAQAGSYMGLYAMGQMDLARDHIARAKELIEKLGTRRFMARALHYEGKILLWEGKRMAALELLNEAMAISRETGIQYAGPTILSDIALATDDVNTRRQSLGEAEQLLKDGCVGHNYFEFYITAMHTSLQYRDWNSIERYATALENYTIEEPLPLTDYFISWGRTLAEFGRNPDDGRMIEELQRLHDEAEKIRLVIALPALKEALGAMAQGL